MSNIAHQPAAAPSFSAATQHPPYRSCFQEHYVGETAVLQAQHRRQMAAEVQRLESLHGVALRQAQERHANEMEALKVQQDEAAAAMRLQHIAEKERLQGEHQQQVQHLTEQHKQEMAEQVSLQHKRTVCCASKFCRLSGYCAPHHIALAIVYVDNFA